MKVTGSVLAAGRSARMGRAKATLAAGPGESFITQLVTTLLAAGLTDVCVVVRAGDDIVAPALAARGWSSTVRIVENPAADVAGQLSSVQAAVTAARAAGADGLLVVPVDMPLVTAATVRSLLETFGAARAPIVRAVHKGRHGHPVIFSRLVFTDLLGADPNVGARAVVRTRGAMDVEVDDPGVLQDVDTPADYERLFGGPPR